MTVLRFCIMQMMSSSPDMFADRTWKRSVNDILSPKNIHERAFLPNLPIIENLMRFPNSLSVALVAFEFSHTRACLEQIP